MSNDMDNMKVIEPVLPEMLSRILDANERILRMNEQIVDALANPKFIYDGPEQTRFDIDPAFLKRSGTS